MSNTHRSRADYVERLTVNTKTRRALNPAAAEFKPFNPAAPEFKPFKFVPVEEERLDRWGKRIPKTFVPGCVWSEAYERAHPRVVLPKAPLWEEALIALKIREPYLSSRFFKFTSVAKTATPKEKTNWEYKGIRDNLTTLVRDWRQGKPDEPEEELPADAKAALGVSKEAFMAEFQHRPGEGYIPIYRPGKFDPKKYAPLETPEDIAKEQARVAEITGLQVVNKVEPNVSDPLHSSPAGVQQQRQDFSNEKHSTKDGTKLGKYYLGKTLGEGEFGKVKLGWRPGTTIQVAVKIIKKERLRDSTRMQKIFREVNILRGLNHPNIVRLYEMVETDRYIGIVLEYAPCGELFNYILNRRYLPDKHAKRLFAQLVSAVGYLHKKGIIHRDLKLENLLLDRNQNLLVTDFGFANTFNPDDQLSEDVESKLNDRAYVEKHKLGQAQSNGLKRGDLMATSCGSPCYAAPELVISDGLYTGRKVDVWSVGVILYAMLAGYLPYDDDPRNPDGDNITLLYQYISDTDLKFPDYVTPHARDLLKRILKPDPRQRADLFEVARHSWLSGYENVVESITSDTTTAANISDAATASNDRNAPTLGRSVSAREPSQPASSSPQAGALLSKHGNVGDLGDSMVEDTVVQRAQPPNKKRQTVQVEYVPPLRPTEGEMDPEDPDWYEPPPEPGLYPIEWYDYDKPLNERKRLWMERQYNKGKGPIPEGAGIRPVVPSKDDTMTYPSRPQREPQRSATDSNFGTISASRPATQGSIGPGSRLPSRGSYGQPVAAQVATTSAQGHFSQPRPSGSVPYGTHGPSEGETMSYSNGRGGEGEKPSRYSTPDPTKQKRGHSRSHTLSGLTQKVFGRTPSTKKTTESRPRPDRSHPPVSMKPAEPGSAPRKSSESRMSHGFGRKSSDFANTNSKRDSKRFSFIPRWGSSKADLTPPTTGDIRESPRPQAGSPAMDGAYDGRPAQAQYVPQPASSHPPTSYSLNHSYPYGTNQATTTNNTQATYLRNVSAGSATANNAQRSQPSQQWPLSYQPDDVESDVPSRFESPATTTAGHNERVGTGTAQAGRAPWESENWSSNRKWQQGKSGPAQRVMDFFRGRRHERTGMA